jgi:hypothetical protein
VSKFTVIEGDDSGPAEVPYTFFVNPLLRTADGPQRLVSAGHCPVRGCNDSREIVLTLVRPLSVREQRHLMKYLADWRPE